MAGRGNSSRCISISMIVEFFLLSAATIIILKSNPTAPGFGYNGYEAVVSFKM
jgi:hypothetical protein